MASESYPNSGHNSGAVSNLEHERLTHAQASDGLIGHPGDDPLVYADGTGTRLVKLRAEGLALVRGSQWYSGSSVINMPSLAANGSGQPRIDLVVLRLNRADYTVTEAAITGTPGANPVAPSPTADIGSTGTWDMPVATVRVESGATAITSDKVKNVAWYINNDGQILCTASTRPSHHVGRSILETDTGRLYLSNGTSWMRAVEDSGITAASVVSGYTASHNTLHIRNGWVFSQLTVSRNASMSAGVAYQVATVPAGYRPPYVVQSVAVVRATGVVAAISVDPGNGMVRVNLSANLSANQSIVLSGLPWPTA